MTEKKVKYIKLNGIEGVKEFCALSIYERCLLHNPELKDIRVMEEFLDSGDHLRFEQYDLDNNTDGFETMYNEDKLECMYAHRKLTDVFEWDNFDKWLANKEKTT